MRESGLHQLLAPRRGELWMADLSGTRDVRGHEQAGRRPVLILSSDEYNDGPAGMVIVAPLTRTVRPLPTIIRLEPPQGGVRATSGILCDQLRAISKQRLSDRWGALEVAVMADVERALRALLRL